MRGEIVTRLRGAAVLDPYSGESTGTDWTTPTEYDIATIVPAEPRPSGEPVQEARHAVTSGFTLYLPANEDVLASDRMRVRGREYDVLGDPSLWLGAGLVVQVGRTDG